MSIVSHQCCLRTSGEQNHRLKGIYNIFVSQCLFYMHFPYVYSSLNTGCKYFFQLRDSGNMTIAKRM